MVLLILHYNLLLKWLFLIHWCSNLNFFDKTNTLGAYLITPATGSNFVIYLGKMQGSIVELYWQSISLISSFGMGHIVLMHLAVFGGSSA